MESKIELVVATGNIKKKKEIIRLLKNTGLRIKYYSLLDFPEPPAVKEDGKSFKENAEKKAITIARYTRKLTLADDSGL
ncbi:MAG: non-canonical purine NTP pyrophosphatase, partial [Candidatus Omnitrophica bacterium]|nr:non-canonical purine NTP pyrophosphatase [Candidatus Omnitrophota bacterium]